MAFRQMLTAFYRKVSQAHQHLMRTNTPGDRFTEEKRLVAAEGFTRHLISKTLRIALR
jgi:hypothetical protein